MAEGLSLTLEDFKSLHPRSLYCDWLFWIENIKNYKCTDPSTWPLITHKDSPPYRGGCCSTNVVFEKEQLIRLLQLCDPTERERWIKWQFYPANSTERGDIKENPGMSGEELKKWKAAYGRRTQHVFVVIGKSMPTNPKKLTADDRLENDAFDSAVKLLKKSRTETTQQLTSINDKLVAATRAMQAKDNIEELKRKIETAEQKLAEEERIQMGMADELAALAKAVQDCKEEIEQHKKGEEKKRKHIQELKTQKKQAEGVNTGSEGAVDVEKLELGRWGWRRYL